MLKFLVRIFYHNKIYTDKPHIFYKLYKWHLGLYPFLALQRIIFMFVFCILGIVWILFIKPRIYGLLLINVALLLLSLIFSEDAKRIKFNALGARTKRQIRLMRAEEFIRKFITQNGKALEKKDWKAIKETDIGLYNILLSDEGNHLCYYYSLQIARIIKDSTLMWCGVKEPFKEGHIYSAHAVIIRNGYIYDSNLRQSERYEDFVKLYKFKLYKKWEYDEYSKKDFREIERTEFRKWCKENNVLNYEKF